MNLAEASHQNTRWSFRSVVTVIAFALIGSVLLVQHQQNQNLRHQVETLSSKINHLNASDNELQAKLDLLIDHVSDEPRLSIPLVENQPRQR